MHDSGIVPDTIHFGKLGPLFNDQVGRRCTSRLICFRCMVRLGTCAQAASAVLKVTEGVEYSKFNHRVQVVKDLFTLLNEDRSTTELRGRAQLGRKGVREPLQGVAGRTQQQLAAGIVFGVQVGPAELGWQSLSS